MRLRLAVTYTCAAQEQALASRYVATGCYERRFLPCNLRQGGIMWQLYHQCSKSTMSWVLSLNHQEWLIVLMAVTAFGFLCMRGFGSRNHY